MFKTPQQYRTFLTVLLTYTLDLVGFSIVFPVLAPLLLNQNLHFFEGTASELTRTTALGFLFAIFGVAQFIGSPLAGVFADHYGRYKVFLWSIALSIIGYVIMAFSIYNQSLSLLFIGRVVTGLCSGNYSIAQSVTADLTDAQHRSKAFGILLGVGGLGFVIGPWIGGKLANPQWLSGSGAFIFAAIAAAINFLIVLFFFVETLKKNRSSRVSFLQSFKDIRTVFQRKKLRLVLVAYLLFSIGWGFFLIFSPTYMVQKFSLTADSIGDIFAYMALNWFFVSMLLNKELTGKFSLKNLILIGSFLASVGIAWFVVPSSLWPYWFIIPVALLGGALAWINLGALLSLEAPENMQGRVLGVGGAMWSIGQIVAPLVAGPLAGWNIYLPLLTGAWIVLVSFIYFLFMYRGK